MPGVLVWISKIPNRWWLIAVIIVVVIALVVFGFFVLVEAYHFYYEEAAFMDEMARMAEDTHDIQLWMVGAAGYRGIAAFDAAVAATSFALASLIVGLAAFIRQVRRSERNPNTLSGWSR